MKRYVALLRGINISGKNKILMADLKKEFEKLGFEEVKTYLNSGNIIFSTAINDIENITKEIATMIKKIFTLEIPVLVVLEEKLIDIVNNAPKWWGGKDKTIYDNLIFILPPATFDEVYYEMGNPKDGLERIFNYQDAIFWSFVRKDYQKTNWWSKTANSNISHQLTIRTANTIKKIIKM